MQTPEPSFNKNEYSYFLFGGQSAHEQFLNNKSLKNKHEFLKFRPETYGYESDEHLTEEGRVLLEFIKLHRSNEINLNQHLAYLKDLTPYSQSIEGHFGLFKNLSMAFAGKKHEKALKALIDKMDVVGSVLLQEIDYNRNIIEDKVETIATFAPDGTVILNTPSNKAKMCKFYTPHSTHVVVFARIKTSPDAKPTSPYPFFIPLRDPKTLDLNNGITMKWLGPSFGGLSGREYAFEFKDFAIPVEKILLDKYLSFENNKPEVNVNNMIIDFTTRVCLALEQERRIEKSVREALKAAYLTVRHSHNRTQFKTLDEKGKERPIFDYNYNKTRIMKGLVEILNFYPTCDLAKKGLYFAASNPQKNFEILKEFFVFYDMFEVYVNERCLIVIESFRESLGGIGYLKFSGIPSLQENAMKNAVLTGPSKEINYLRFAQFFVNTDINNLSTFLRFVAPRLFIGNELDFVTKEPNYERKPSFFLFFLNNKLLTYRQRFIDNSLLKPSEDCAKLLKTMTNFEDVTKLCETFVLFSKVTCLHNKVGVNLNRSNLKEIFTTIGIETLANVQEDLPYYLSQEGKLWPKDKLETITQSLALLINELGEQSVQIVESFGFDENLLHSCIAKTADETYENMLRMSKYHNPRNNPKVQEEIRRELLAFLNRAPASKL